MNAAAADGLTEQLAGSMVRKRAMKGTILRWAVAGWFAIVGCGAEPVALVRGPYLQLARHDSMTVRWRTSAETVGRVRHGTAPDNLAAVADETLAGTEHSVTLSGLTPSTTYYYSVGSPEEVLAGGDAAHSFRTPPSPDSPERTRIWTFGDCGTGNYIQLGVRDAFQHFAAGRGPDLLLLLGDNAYNNGTDTEYQTNFFDIYQPILRRAPVWPCIGNHDTANLTDPAIDHAYFRIFSVPQAGEAGGIPSQRRQYYSFDRGQIHFVCLDSMTSDMSATGEMATWLAADLAATTKKWIIACFHHAPYSKGSHNSDVEGPMVQARTQIVPILEEKGVDLVLTGHSHNYERTVLLDGHYGVSSTLTAAMKKDPGNGREGGGGAYLKPWSGPRSRQGVVYAVVGSAGSVGAGLLDHPAMSTGLNRAGSLVIDIEGSRLDAWFVEPAGTPWGSLHLVTDHFTILKTDAIDRDRDGIPDEVETARQMDPLDPADAAGDLDGDGVTNLEEYRFEWRADAAQPHRLWARVDPASGRGRVAFHAAAGLRHRVLASADLIGWSPASGWFDGDDRAHAWVDEAGPPAAAGLRFYRIERLSTAP